MALKRRENPRGRTLLASQVEAIEYKHGWDGLPYRHDFTKKGTRAYLRRDGSVEIENPDATLWDYYGGKPYLINHPKGARPMARRKARRNSTARKSNRPAARRRRTTSGGRKKRPVPAGYSSWKEYMASIRPGGSRRRKARRRNPQQGGEVARQSNPRRRGRSRAKARRHHSSRRRRNPPGLSMRGISGRIQEGVIGGLAVTGGKLAVRAIPTAAGLPAMGFAGIAVQLGLAVGASMVTDKVLGRRFGPDVLKGGFAAVIESLVKKANVPMISAALGDEYDLLAAYPLNIPGSLSAYPGQDLAAYPRQLAGDTYVE